MSTPDRDAPTEQRTPPHPPLGAYYASPGERQAVVDGLFDDSAPYYDWICRVMSAGTGSSYRRQVLLKAGLVPGMTLLDVATGTGLVAREAIAIVGDAKTVVGVDPSAGMLRECRKVAAGRLVRAKGEGLPFRDRRFDMVTMGYALRHVSDLDLALREYFRVLKPGGRVVLMEIVRPRSRAGTFLLKLGLKHLVPIVTRLGTGSGRAERLMRYYWDTVVNCVPPETILVALGRAGFTGIERRTLGSILSEYLGSRPL